MADVGGTRIRVGIVGACAHRMMAFAVHRCDVADARKRNQKNRRLRRAALEIGVPPSK